MTNNPSGGCGCRIVLGEPNQEPQGIEYCPLHANSQSMLQFIEDIRPFLGYDPDATLHKRADNLIAAAQGKV